MSRIEYPLGPFVRFAGNPVLRPTAARWESRSVYNPAAVVVGERVAVVYRAHADDIVSSLGLAWSADGLAFEREPEPVMVPEHDYERFGCEDPRITEIDGTFYLTYTAWDRVSARLCLATSDDLRSWTKHGPLFPGFDTFLGAGPATNGTWSKGGAILADPIDGRYLMYFGEGNIFLATSTDLLHWDIASARPVLAPEPGTFMGDLVETGPPPILTSDGRILLMHNSAVYLPGGAVSYTCGQVLIDPAEPEQPLTKMTRPWLAPATAEETHGLVSNVTFVEGLVFFRGRWLAYYGQSDTTVGVAILEPAT